MSVLSPPAPRRDEPELLMREAGARQRQRQRRVLTAATVALSAACAFAVYSVVVGRSSATKPVRRWPIASLPRCRTNQLRLSAYLVNAGAGSETTGFTLTNISAGSCTLHGWPTLRLVMRGGRAIAPHAREIRLTEESTPLRVQTVLLRPRGAASFDVGGILQVGRRGPLDRKCSAGARAVLVTPRGGAGPLRVAHGLTYCGPKSLWVYPFASGRMDRQWGK